MEANAPKDERRRRAFVQSSTAALLALPSQQQSSARGGTQPAEGRSPRGHTGSGRVRSGRAGPARPARWRHGRPRPGGAGSTLPSNPRRLITSAPAGAMAALAGSGGGGQPMGGRGRGAEAGTGRGGHNMAAPGVLGRWWRLALGGRMRYRTAPWRRARPVPLARRGVLSVPVCRRSAAGDGGCGGRAGRPGRGPL